MLLQEELAKDELYTEVHMTVPNEFYGVYVAHTTFHMYTADHPEAYEMKRVLRHAMNQLMIDFGDNDKMNLKTLKVTMPLPEDANQLFADLLDMGHLWIGYRLSHSFHWNDRVQNSIQFLFPKEDQFGDARQHQLILNPFGNPVSRHSWLDCRENIVELIAIGGDDDVELF